MDDTDFRLSGGGLLQNEGVAGTLHKRKVPDDDAGHRKRHQGQEDQEAASGGKACGRDDGHGQAQWVDAAAVAAGEGYGAVGLAAASAKFRVESLR